MITEQEIRDVCAARDQAFREWAKIEDQMEALKRELRNYQKDTPLFRDCMTRIEEFAPELTRAQRGYKLAEFQIRMVSLLARLR